MKVTIETSTTQPVLSRPSDIETNIFISITNSNKTTPKMASDSSVNALVGILTFCMVVAFLFFCFLLYMRFVKRRVLVPVDLGPRRGRSTTAVRGSVGGDSAAGTGEDNRDVGNELGRSGGATTEGPARVV
ncbi:uncharacterized protein CCOS01_10331 [Colletotrichum costaricense]|uniref:Uncharacterized protein n=1 Tax=Colletotrichum costaricense TaxID=1209916 RepID=A0AAI9YT68_9PEZI|nr:uncharacterized protein CCOS01_10331 [Colletotrichum costaricense]KAK1522619.1 hypothetical protein CCOS01_10331 [Colletotrichum costaricense]